MNRLTKTQKLINVSRGLEEGDLLLKNCKIVNVFSGTIEESNIIIVNKKIAGIGDYKKAKEVLDLKGSYVSPGFIDAHAHIESSMITPFEFARAVVPLGTTSVIVDPHEIANVLGHDGIKFMLESSKNNHISLYFMLPSCVPATTHLETSASILSAEDIYPFMSEKWVVGLGEVMNYPGILNSDSDLLNKLKIAKKKRSDGHAPNLSGFDLNAYIASGISTDHECTEKEEAFEKLNRGMKILIREGSAAKNLDSLIGLVNDHNYKQFLFCTDDRHPEDLVNKLHINYNIKKAIKSGINPITAIRMATINVVEHYKIDRKGAVAPGYWADLVVFDNFESFNIEKVFRSGIKIAENYKFVAKAKKPKLSKLRGTVNVGYFDKKKLEIKDTGKKIKVITTVKDQIITNFIECKPESVDNNGNIISDIKNDILKITVIERHLASGNVGVGFVKGFGMKRGAIASTVAHDSHNIIAIGTNDEDISFAVKSLIDAQGGNIVVDNCEIKALLQLSIAGLMSTKNVQEVAKEKLRLQKACEEIQTNFENPFMVMSFLALPVIPHLKITDKGLVDVDQFKVVDIYS